MGETNELPKVLGILDTKAKSAAGFSSDQNIVALECSDTAAEHLSKHIHDLRSCTRSVEILLKMVEDGESFEGAQNKLMVEQVRKSTEVLRPTVNFLKSIYAAGS